MELNYTNCYIFGNNDIQRKGDNISQLDESNYTFYYRKKIWWCMLIIT